MPRRVKLTSSTVANHTISLVTYPDKSNLKWEIESIKQKQGASENQCLTNTPARVMYVQNLYLKVPP